MQNPSQPFPKPVHALDTKEQENQQTPVPNKEEEKAVCIIGVCIIGGESEALGFHQKIQERRNDHQDLKENKKITIGSV